MNVCVRPWVWRSEECRGPALALSTVFIPSSQGLLLNLELGWQPAGLSGFPIFVPCSPGVTGPGKDMSTFYIGAGYSPKLSGLHS